MFSDRALRRAVKQGSVAVWGRGASVIVMYMQVGNYIIINELPCFGEGGPYRACKVVMKSVLRLHAPVQRWAA